MPFALRNIVNAEAQTLVRFDQIVISIFPGCGRAVTIHVFGKSQSLAYLTAIEQATRQGAALNVSHALAEQLDHFVLVAKDDFQ